MTAYGYKRTLWGRALNFRFTTDSRHSNRHFRFPIVFVCFWGTSGRMAGLSVESVVDPKRALRVILGALTEPVRTRLK